MEKRVLIARSILTAALVLVFGVFGYWKFTDPLSWIGWVPSGMEGMFGLTRDAWLSLIGAAEILMAILLLVPVRRVRQTAALLIAIQLCGVVLIAGWNDIGVRDIGLLLSSLALLVLL